MSDWPREFELWQRVAGGVNDAVGWMVWRVGPTTGGEQWFTSEEEARAYVAKETADEAAA